MNLFRSEEHARNWPRFEMGTDDGIIDLASLVKLFSGPYFTRRLDPDYLSKSPMYAMQMMTDMKAIGKTGEFWRMGGG